MINKKVPENGKIMGIAINSSSRRLLLTRVEKLISDSVKFYIVTPNPELILMAQSDGKLKKALNSATLSVADGVGVAMAHKFINLPIPQNRILKLFVTLFQGLKVGMSVFFDKKRLMSNFEIIKGRQVFEDLISLSAKKGWRVFLLGGLGNEAEIASRK
jgi:UDP-N-acetyl-D-mannosaminuronic acid transferase (WecB/TagA/CpsF family)